MIRLRQDVLTGDWVAMNGDRQSRPITRNGTTCPFCPGPHGEVGETPFDVAVFENKFPSFHHPGNAEVVVYSPDHHDDLGYMPVSRVDLIWQVWVDRIRDLEQQEGTEAVFVFENRGQKAGATIAHPHGQIYAYPYIPARLAREVPHFAQDCPLCASDHSGAVLLCSGNFWRLEVPAAMRMPYQVQLVPRRHIPALLEVSADERAEGVLMMQAMLRTYDRFFGLRAALVMGLNQAPVTRPPYHLRWDFLPIDRGAGKIKYLAGSELAMGAFVVDMVPEQVRDRLGPIFDREYRGEVTHDA